MAYAALVCLQESIQKITLNHPILYSNIAVNHIDRSTSLNEGITFLLEFARKFPEAANSLEERIGDAAREAQDVLEHLLRKQIPPPFGLNRCLSFLPNHWRRAKLQQRLENVRRAIDSIAAELMEMEKMFAHKIKEPELPLSETISDSPAENSVSMMEADGVVGFDDDSLAIKTRLCGGPSKLQFIPIVGMGGIGKTTLSQNVYNDPLTIQYFDVRAWATVSQDYSAHRIVSNLMDSVKALAIRKSGQDNEETVYKSLKGRRYLIVLDDVWSTEAWDEIRDLFPNDCNGSRIVLTTRLSGVADYISDCSPLHEMSFMGLEQSWELIRERVFGDEECSPRLEEVGWKIAASCRGLPLAIVVIGGLLSTVERNTIAWSQIANNLSAFASTEDSRVDEILSLSYAHLPHHLRPCFLHMGGFPEDHEIRLSKLVKLWVAEGFSSFEEEAEECLEDLVNRSLVLVTKRRYNGRIKSCALHDVIRDLCISKAKENNFSLNILDRHVEKKSFVDGTKDQNRISIRTSSLKYLSSIHHSNIRTIMCFHKYNTEERRPAYLDFLKRVKLLRVLDAQYANVGLLPDALYELFHLRYLAIRGVMMLPASIQKLQNLQTLIVSDRWEHVERLNVECLPQEIWMMPQLRHLICYGRFPCPKEATCTLENLHTLSAVLHDICVGGILEKMPNIKKLGVDCSYYDHGTHLNNLGLLHRLESLELRNADWRRDSISLPRTLRKLTLRNMSLLWSEMSIVGLLPNLEVLKLREFACIGSTWETSQGEFLRLQYLQIETSKLQHWITEGCHFPRLRWLLLHECWYLSEIPEGIGEIATLELIDLRGRAKPVPESLAESAKRIQEEQQNLGNDALQVHNRVFPAFGCRHVKFKENN